MDGQSFPSSTLSSSAARGRRTPPGRHGSRITMLHYTCDHCGKELRPEEDCRYVIKIEAAPAHDPCELTDADLDEDHLEAVSQLLRDDEDGPPLEEPRKSFRYDLCHECHGRFVRDPLGKEQTHKLFF